MQIVPLRAVNKEEGYRVLALPEWPKGLKRDSIDCWAKDLSPDLDLLKHRNCGLSALAFACVYRSLLSRSCMQNLLKPLALMSLRRRVTFPCGCTDPDFCHERIIVEALEKCRQGGDFSVGPADCKARS